MEGKVRVRTTRAIGIEPSAVWVEAERKTAGGLKITGLSEAQERETRVRVASALASAGIKSELAVNVQIQTEAAPAISEPIDLALAFAVWLALSPVRPSGRTGEPAVYGALGLDGRLEPVRGLFASRPSFCTLRAHERVSGWGAGACAIVPRSQAGEAALCHGDVVLAGSFEEAIERFSEIVRGNAVQTAPKRELVPTAREAPAGFVEPDFQAELAEAAGAGSVLLIGPPGAGKTMTARYLARLAPLWTAETMREALAVWSVAGLLTDGANGSPPFRAPHHSVSMAGLVGGGNVPRPGEVSLAHGGVLFLDEFTEFRALALNTLLEALKTGQSVVCRAGVRVAFPARPALVIGTANPCPCGYHGSRRRTCRCNARAIERYRARFDLFPWAKRIELAEMDLATLTG